jgi:pyruvate-formate lyase-activating enzyme
MSCIDGFNMNLKAYCEEFYSSVADGRREPVLQTPTIIRKSGKHLELTLLLVPALNDDLRRFSQWFPGSGMKLESKRHFISPDVFAHVSMEFPKLTLDCV